MNDLVEPNKKDLIGQKFGRLTAQHPVRSEPGKGTIWFCTCECGGSKEVPTGRLIRGTTRSCGCIKAEKQLNKNIVGKRYGRLVAVRHEYDGDNGRDYWLFQCECGNTKIMPAANVKWGNVRSCGCLADEHIENLNKQDIAGMRFFRLVAVEPTQDRDASGSIIWECRCDCGKMVRHSVNKLRSGRTKSCGCLYSESRSECTANRRDVVEDSLLSTLVASKQPRVDSTTGVTGVYYDKSRDKWYAHITFQKKRYFLGTFNEKEKAVKARKNAERKFHDPLIVEKWDSLTEKAKKKYLEYLQEEGSADCVGAAE